MNLNMATKQELRPRGKQKPTHHDKPSRFLNLPPEIRKMVYEDLFQGYRMHVDIPQRLTSSLGQRNAKSAGASLPGILRVSRSIRQESIPVFSKHLVVVFHNRRGSRQIPDEYLRFTKTAIIYDVNTKYINDVVMPKLELLVVKQFLHETPALHGNLAYSIKEHQADSKVVKDFIRVFKSGRFCSELRATHGDGPWRFEVYLRQSVSVEETMGTWHHAKRFAFWNAPVVNYQDRVIALGPPRPTFANMPVQRIARKLQFK